MRAAGRVAMSVGAATLSRGLELVGLHASNARSVLYGHNSRETERLRPLSKWFSAPSAKLGSVPVMMTTCGTPSLPRPRNFLGLLALRAVARAAVMPGFQQT